MTRNASPKRSTLRPDSDTQTQLEACDSRRLDPRGTAQNGGDDGVRHSSLPSDGAKASVTNRHPQILGNLAHDFSDRVRGDSAGPLGTADAGSISPGANHPATVSEGAAATPRVDFSAKSTLRSTPSTGHNYDHWSEKGQDLSRRIDQYVPALPASQWAEIADFVRAAVLDADPNRVDTAKNWLNSVAYLVAWATDSGTCTLDRAEVFSSRTIDLYIRGSEFPNSHTRGTVRSRLYDIADRLIGPQDRTVEAKRHSRSKTPAPYSAREVAQLRSLMAGQSTDYRRQNLGALLGLCAGAGLRAGEVSALLAEDVLVGPDGIALSVRGARPRTVAVLTEWEDVLFEAVEVSQTGVPFFLPERVVLDSNKALTKMTASLRATTVRVQTGRLRSTWIVRHLNAGTHFPTLLRGAGLNSQSNLNGYLPFVDVLPDEVAFAALRNGGSK